jgi:hypothetical protein
MCYVSFCTHSKRSDSGYSGKAISFTDTDFSVYESDDRITWKKLKVYTSDEYYRIV